MHLIKVMSEKVTYNLKQNYLRKNLNNYSASLNVLCSTFLFLKELLKIGLFRIILKHSKNGMKSIKLMHHHMLGRHWLLFYYMSISFCSMFIVFYILSMPFVCMANNTETEIKIISNINALQDTRTRNRHSMIVTSLSPSLYGTLSGHNDFKFESAKKHRKKVSMNVDEKTVLSLQETSQLSQTTANFLKHFNRQSLLSVSKLSDNLNVNMANTDLEKDRCQSCQARDKAKLENLESIKKHILLRLKLSAPPNISSPILVPKKILDNFYADKDSLVQKDKFKFETIPHNENRIELEETLSIVVENQDTQKYDVSAINERLVERALKEDLSVEHQKNTFERLSNKNLYYTAEKESETSDEFFSHVKSIFILPKASCYHHKNIPEILHFKLKGNFHRVTRIILHMFLKSQATMKIMMNRTVTPRFNNAKPIFDIQKEIVITVFRASLRRNVIQVSNMIPLIQANFKVPENQGRWIKLEVPLLAQIWASHKNSTIGIILKASQPSMQRFLLMKCKGSFKTLKNKSLAVFIEANTQSVGTRQKRSSSMDCSESDNEVRCCRYPLRVNFSNFGWNWVVAPTYFNAYFCNGECKLGFLERHAHTHLASLSTSAQPCCSPTKMSPLKLLYFNSDQILVLSTIPNMSVEKCSCS